MKNVDIIRAWKDESYRNNLTADQISQLPANPAGNLSEEQLKMISGGCGGISRTAKLCSTCNPCTEK